MRSETVRIRYATCAELRARLAAAGGRDSATDALGPRERSELAAWRHPTRRENWLLGRRLCRELLDEAFCDGLLDVDPQAIEILSRDGDGRGQRPRAFVGEEPLGLSLSASHTRIGVLVALAVDPAVSVGVDLTIVERFDPSFVRTWFAPAEQRRLLGQPDRDVATFWAIKEATYKALQRGESFAPRRAEVTLTADGRYGCRYDGDDLTDRATIDVWEIDGQVAAAVTAAIATVPVVTDFATATARGDGSFD